MSAVGQTNLDGVGIPSEKIIVNNLFMVETFVHDLEYNYRFPLLILQRVSELT